MRREQDRDLHRGDEMELYSELGSDIHSLGCSALLISAVNERMCSRFHSLDMALALVVPGKRAPERFGIPSKRDITWLEKRKTRK